MEFSGPAYWSVWPFPSPWDLPDPGIEPRSPTVQADSLAAEPQLGSFHRLCVPRNAAISVGGWVCHVRVVSYTGLSYRYYDFGG